jgi:ubiquinol-cytochrome c reductase iron-sulfur subunit
VTPDDRVTDDEIQATGGAAGFPVEIPTSRPSGGESVPAFAFLAAVLGALGFIVAYVVDAGTQILGVLVFVMAGGIGVGMVAWAKRYMTPAEPDIEPRGRIQSTEDEIQRFAADFNVGEYELARRSLLTKLLLAAVGAMGLASIVPFASLGPKPDESFKKTKWRKGVRVVDLDGRPIRGNLVNADAVLTVFPDGDVGDDLAQTVLIGLRPGRYQAPPGREDWTPHGVIAYSKICTHVGCPVGMYEAESGQLLCPCHQSTFDVYHSAEPIFGPASTPLPQLPLGTDDEGYLIATGDFSSPPGPSYWDQRKVDG